MKGIYKALLITEDGGKFNQELKQLNLSQLPDNDLLVKVKYSSLNYKDALSASGNKGVTRVYPHVPGIDAAGTVIKSKTAIFQEGAEVLITGFDMGMNTWGGFAEYIAVPASWAVKLPEQLTLEETMQYGTAGLTAGLMVDKILKAGILPENGDVIVSGATGGVGSISTAILSKLGFKVVAVSGKDESKFLINTLGADKVMSRNEFVKAYNSKNLNKESFAAGIDTTGGAILSGMLKSTRYGGVVACCGMVASTELQTSIFPFILRGITLAGVDSVLAPAQQRQYIWKMLANEWKPSNLSELVLKIDMDSLIFKLNDILNGKAKGRYLLEI